MPGKQQSNGFLIERDENTMVFRRPTYLRILSGLLAILFTLMTGIILFGLIATLATAHRKDSLTLFVLTLFSVMFGVLMLSSASLAAALEMRFDLRTRTYRYRHGLLFVVPTREGSFEDIDYLYLRTLIYDNYGDRKPDSRLYLVWKHAPRLFGIVPQPDFLLQMLSRIEQIEQEGAECAQLLNVPLEFKRRGRPAGAALPSPTSPERRQDTHPAAGAHQRSQPSASPVAGKVVKSDGPVVEVQFSPGNMPPIYNAIVISYPILKPRDR